ANVYPTRDFLACGLGEGASRGCRHCPLEWESCSHIIGYCPAVQEARIKRHNDICGVLAEEARKIGWEIYIEPHLRDSTNELFKPDLILVKGSCAKVVDVTVCYGSGITTLSDAAAEKARKYQHLAGEVRVLTSAMEIEFLGFPVGARGKWYVGNDRLLSDTGLSTSRCKWIARVLSQRALLSLVDIIHIFVSRGRQ
ncbi:hypothetical protein N309_01748, partial [Tinamus guttatus]